MPILYSNTTKGFYDQDAHVQSGMAWPPDLIEVTEAEREFIKSSIASGIQIACVQGSWVEVEQTHAQRGERDSSLKTQIAAIESCQGRALREAVLGITGGTARLTEIERQIAALRSQLSTS